MRRATIVVGALSLLMSGCYTGRGRAESQWTLVKPGMAQSEVKELLGEPDQIAAHGNPDGPGMVIEWNYRYETPFTMYLAPKIGMLTIVFCYPSVCCLFSLGMTATGHLYVEFGSDLKMLRARTDLPLQ